MANRPGPLSPAQRQLLQRCLRPAFAEQLGGSDDDELPGAIERGWLEQDAHGRFRTTDAGRRLLEGE